MNNSDRIKMDKEIDTMLDATQAVVDTMDNGKRKQIKDIAEAVGISVAMEPKKVLGFVNYFLHNTELGYVTRGKNGGFIKGTKPVKVVKLVKVDVQVIPDDTDTEDETV